MSDSKLGFTSGVLSILSTLMLCACVHAGEASPPGLIRVNGQVLSQRQSEVVAFIANTVVPTFPGNRREQIDRAALATWWSLREGVISDWAFKRSPIIHLFSNCTDGSDQLIDPFTLCKRGHPWQVGLPAVQVYTPPPSAKEQSKRVNRIIASTFPGSNGDRRVLNEVANLANLSPAAHERILQLPDGPLRTSWLMRHPVIDMRMVPDDEVIPECFPPNPEQARKWCYSGNPGSAGYLYAHDSKVALHALEDIKHALEALQTSH